MTMTAPSNVITVALECHIIWRILSIDKLIANLKGTILLTQKRHSRDYDLHLCQTQIVGDAS